MLRSVTRVAIAAAMAASTAAAAAAPTIAQPPEIEHVKFEETVTDDFLTEMCGVQVTATVKGNYSVITFGDDGTGLQEVRTVNASITVSADGNTYRFRNVGADVVRVEPDGTVILMLIGQLPFFFNGVMKIDLETGEVLMEPQHSTEDEVAEACEALTS
jgi:hypothetical protein